MTWLNAALAFALSMIVFSTIVSAIVEAVHGVAHMRARGLRHLLEVLYDEYLAKQVDGALGAAGDQIRKDYLDKLTRNYGVDTSGPLGIFGRAFARRGLDSLTTTELARRLADTELGSALRARGADEIERVLDEAGRRFERFGADASQYFRGRAQLISAIAALLLAFALNIDAVRLVSTFLVDRELTAQIIANADAIKRGYLAQQERAETAAAADAAPAAPAPVVPAPAIAPAPAVAPVNDPSLESQVADLRKQLAMTTALGLPIGHAYYPYCNTDAEASPDPRCREIAAKKPGAARRALGWVLSTLITGALIALGGPFWFDAFKRLSALVDLGKALRGGDAAQQPNAPPAPEPPPKPSQAFLESSSGSAPLLRRGRKLLRSDGRLL